MTILMRRVGTLVRIRIKDEIKDQYQDQWWEPPEVSDEAEWTLVQSSFAPPGRLLRTNFATFFTCAPDDGDYGDHGEGEDDGDGQSVGCIGKHDIILTPLSLLKISVVIFWQRFWKWKWKHKHLMFLDCMCFSLYSKMVMRCLFFTWQSTLALIS